MTGPRNGAVVREIRAELGRQDMSRRKLAQIIGKPDTTVARWLRNATAMDSDEIEAIAVALKVTPLDLFARAFAQSPVATSADDARTGWKYRAHLRSRNSGPRSLAGIRLHAVA